MTLIDLILKQVKNRYEDPENPRPSFEHRLTPLHGMRLVSLEQAGGTFEFDKEVVFDYIRHRVRDIIPEVDLEELKSVGIDYPEMAVKSPSKTLEYHSTFMKGILPKETFDKLSTVLGELTLLEKTEVYYH